VNNDVMTCTAAIMTGTHRVNLYCCSICGTDLTHALVDCDFELAARLAGDPSRHWLFEQLQGTYQFNQGKAFNGSVQSTPYSPVPSNPIAFVKTELVCGA
jgi:hypothetical protein